MLNSHKEIISKKVNQITDLFKIIMCFFLICIVIIWLAQIFHCEDYIPNYGSISSFLTKFNSYFVTPDVRDEGNANIMYLSINIIILLIVFSFISDIMKDMMKMYERSREEAIEEDNIRINEQIKKNYEFHLKHTMQFVLMIRLKFRENTERSLAFSDLEYSAKLAQASINNLEEIKSIINTSIQCHKSQMGDDIVLYIKTPEQLNRVLIFVRSVCKIEKYVKSGLEYYISVVTYTVEETPDAAASEAIKLINLGCKNKVICHQIVSECLQTVSDNNFIAMASGNYEDIPDSLYELVEKNSY